MPGPVSSTCSTTTWPNGRRITRTVTRAAGRACTAARCRPGCGSARAAASRGRRRRARRRRAGLGAFVAEVDALVERARHEVAHRLGRERAPGRRLARDAPARWSSARAIASSWLTMCAARWLERRDLLQRLLQRLRSSRRRRSRAAPARPACAGRPAASSAGARRRRGSASACAIDCVSRASRSLIDAHQRRHLLAARGARRSGSGRRLSRARMRCCSSCSGAMPRASASQTSSTASGRITNCGRITPLMISVASARALVERLGHLHQRAGVPRAGAGRPTHSVGDAHRRRRASSSSRKRTSPARRASSSARQRQVARRRRGSSPRGPSTW